MTIKPTLMALSLAMAMAACAMAAPVNLVIVNGQVTFTQDGNTLTVTNSPNAIINWSSFSIAQWRAGAVCTTEQQQQRAQPYHRPGPQRSSVPCSPTGGVSINFNGIVFGAGCADRCRRPGGVEPGDFQRGLPLSNWRFSADGPAGQVSNQGAITTPSGGQVYSIAPDVNNTGIITTPQGETVLAAGHWCSWWTPLIRACTWWCRRIRTRREQPGHRGLPKAAPSVSTVHWSTSAAR